MLKRLKNIFKGVHSSRALKNSFIVNYHRYLQGENEGISSIIESQGDNVFKAVINDVDNKLSEIAKKETRVEQMREIRRTILEYLEERIQSQIYFDKKWSEEKRSIIGKHLLPDLEEAIIPEQERSIYIVSTIAFFVFCLVSAELYKDNNTWIKEYIEIFRKYAELGVDFSLEEDPAMRDILERVREPMLNSILEWQSTNVYGH